MKHGTLLALKEDLKALKLSTMARGIEAHLLAAISGNVKTLFS